MPEKDPLNYSMMTYAWVILLSAWGGIASYANKVKTRSIHLFSITELVGEMMISGFAGLMTFFLCESANIDQVMAAVMIGISGHMGSRSILLLERWLKNRFVDE